MNRQKIDWNCYIEGLISLGESARKQLSDPEDDLLAQELYRYIYLILTQNYSALVYQDADYPDFWPQFGRLHNFIISCVDNSYYQTPLKPDGVYKIVGVRGSAHLVDFQVGSESFTFTGLGNPGPPLDNYDLDQCIDLGEGGAFEFVLSAERPANYSGNWLALNPSATHLLVREVFYDWETELSGRYAIERTDVPAIRPRATAREIAGQMQTITESTTNWVNYILGFTRSLKERGMINQIAVQDFSDSAGLSTQIYMSCLYDIQQDEALVLEMDIPNDCFYWNFTIYDEIWRVADWLGRFCSINGRQAKRDSDGKVRVVISAQDPGTPNWLDVADYQRGGLFGRFNRCPAEPQIVTKIVKLPALRQQLPDDTPSISPHEREQALRARCRAIQLRRRW